MLGLSGQALADCERGQLDALYCDENGDMVADLPKDKSKWADPDTLIFAYTPVRRSRHLFRYMEPFIDHLSEVTGRDVRFFAVQSNSARGRSHCAVVVCISPASPQAQRLSRLTLLVRFLSR